MKLEWNIENRLAFQQRFGELAERKLNLAVEKNGIWNSDLDDNEYFLGN